MEIHLIDVTLFISFFLIITGLLQRWVSKISFMPYTVALLILGFLAQYIVKAFHLPIHLEMSPDMIYFVLLPLLLFEAAFHINFHQFRIQFKTITFIATFGLLLSIFTIGYTLAYLAGLPLQIAILFGAIISATDPIAVITLFKSLGAPKRLGLVADGESMLNDATGVIAFRVVSGFVLAGSQFQTKDIGAMLGNFSYVFFGSLIFGALVGYIFSKIVENIHRDRVIETTITVAAALGSFAAAEHFFHFSGVITTVITGLVMGNLGKTKFSDGVKGFVEEFWEYFAFLSVSLVFFFATFNLDLNIFTKNPMHVAYAIFAVLLGRAVSVYVSFYLTNNLSFFKDEPNVPMGWQHILNWGGLRGVIPLVLVYSLPENFEYREEMLSFTMGAFLFTLFVNGITVRNLLLALGLHLPKKEEEIIKEEMTLFNLEEAKMSVAKLENEEFDKELIANIKSELNDQEKKHKDKLMDIAKEAQFEKSLKLQSIAIERQTLEHLYAEGYITENVYYQFDTELDLQQDAIEYPITYKEGIMNDDGTINTQRTYRNTLAKLRNIGGYLPFLKPFLRESRDVTILDRVALLKARIITSERVVEYFNRLRKIMSSHQANDAIITQLVEVQNKLISENTTELKKLTNEHPRMIREYQKNLAYSVIEKKSEGSEH